MTKATTDRTRYMTEMPRNKHGQYYLVVDLNADSAADGGLAVQWVPTHDGYRTDGAVHLIALEDYDPGNLLALTYPVDPDALDAWIDSPEAQALWETSETIWRYADTTKYPQYQQGGYMPEGANAEVTALFDAIDAIAAAVVALPDLGQGSGAWDVWDWFNGDQDEVMASLNEANIEEMAVMYQSIARSHDVKIGLAAIENYLTQLLSWK